MTQDPQSATENPKLEVGWVLAGPLEDVDLQAVQRARRAMQEWLEEHFAEFVWTMPVVRRPEAAQQSRVDPVTLLDVGVAERDAKKWDFALVVTAADLASYYKPFALAVPSQALSTAVLSTARLDPAALLSEARDEQRVAQLSRRLWVLALHQLGHLNDLAHSDDPADLMYNLKTVDDLDQMMRLAEPSAAALREELATEADPRLEEQLHKIRYRWRFYLRAAWINREDIGSAVRHIRPWRFPFRFSRLTTAAVSTMLVLLTTAEAWDLGASQPPSMVIGLSLLTLGGTSYYLLRQQQLLKRRRQHRPSEQRVVARFSIVLAILIGMAATYVLLFAMTLALSLTLFSPELVQGWITTSDPLTHGHYLILAGFVASLGLVIGSLGASFEEQTYFRHVAYVSEET